MAEDKNDPPRELYNYLYEWATRDDQQRALRTQVDQYLGTAAWQIKAMDAIRGRSPEMAREFDAELSRALTNLKIVLPLPTKYDSTTAGSTSSAVAVSSNSAVFQGLVAVDEAQATPEIEAAINEYKDLAQRQHRSDEAAIRLAKTFPNLTDRYKTVQEAISSTRGNSFAEEGAAMEMRTFLQKLYGELLDKARRNPNEQIDWETMAERLSVNDPARAALKAQGSVHEGIRNTLSSFGKGRPSAYGFDEARTRFTDHVYIVCGLVYAWMLVSGGRRPP